MKRKNLLREFEDIVGEPMASSVIELLKQIGPDARTQRISVVIAAILKYAYDRIPDEIEEGTLADALMALADEPHLAQEESPEATQILDLIDSICRAAKMTNERTDSRGSSYSIGEQALSEFCNWYSMPWEDYV